MAYRSGQEVLLLETKKYAIFDIIYDIIMQKH